MQKPFSTYRATYRQPLYSWFETDVMGLKISRPQYTAGEPRVASGHIRHVLNLHLTGLV